jgi:hypothetical protein
MTLTMLFDNFMCAFYNEIYTQHYGGGVYVEDYSTVNFDSSGSPSCEISLNTAEVLSYVWASLCICMHLVCVCISGTTLSLLSYFVDKNNDYSPPHLLPSLTLYLYMCMCSTMVAVSMQPFPTSTFLPVTCLATQQL